MAVSWIDDISAAQWVCIFVVAAIVLTGVVVIVANFISDFSRELKYLNCEIARTSGDERKHWLRKRRRLWLSWIPFVS